MPEDFNVTIRVEDLRYGLKISDMLGHNNPEVFGVSVPNGDMRENELLSEANPAAHASAYGLSPSAYIDDLFSTPDATLNIPIIHDGRPVFDPSKLLPLIRPGTPSAEALESVISGEQKSGALLQDGQTFAALSAPGGELRSAEMEDRQPVAPTADLPIAARNSGGRTI